MKEKIRAFWSGLTPQGKKKVILAIIAVIVGITGVLGYYSTRGKSTKPQQTVSEKKELKFDSSVMEKSLYSESKKEMDQIRQQLEALKKEREEREKQESALKSAPLPPSVPGADRQPSGAQQAIPPVPPPPPPAMHAAEPPKPVVSVEKVGDISVFTAKIETKNMSAVAADSQDDKKKEEGRIYLPPSFMEATLLSGLYAPTAEGGKGSPVPVLLRIKDLAILPNKVKANLKGCFVIAEGYGDLATERANLRLVTLSCVSKKGQAIIDQGIKGFVVDSDGKIGLKGNVVSKMGSAIARSALAGFLGGLGQAIQTAYTTTSVSLAGTTSTVAPADITKVAAGQGLSQATQDLKKFYLDLARQAMPVIEVGATKVVTLVISEGTEINIKDMSTAGGAKGEAKPEQKQRQSRPAVPEQPPAGALQKQVPGSPGTSK